MKDEPSLSEGLATTRSIRNYTDEPVSEAALARVLHLATRAPSGSNRQPFRFIVLRDGPVSLQVRQLLADGAREVWDAKRATNEFPDRAENTPTSRMLASMDAYVANLATAPVIVLPCMIRYRDPVVTEGASIYPAVQNLLLGARSVGLGGALTMFHQFRDAEIRAALAIPDDAFIAATVTIGHPRGSHGPVRRKPLDQVVFEEAWGSAPAWAVDPPGTRFTGGPRPA
jgi:nitroreductase